MICAVNMKNMHRHSVSKLASFNYSIQGQKVYLKRVYEYSLIKQIKFELAASLVRCAAPERSYINIDDIH